ncbi:MAG: response regulator transcription factor [Saprospiraceae bacterium]|nr:response regulator transcription factor [Saprospiraceae bacterium]MBK7795735.1 response regulator transcription factor [Saprospiraceae bacterium]MBL0260847.1 response regulator transcription factor [Saprospiraceae bacterium]
MSVIRVGIVDDHLLFLQSFGLLLKRLKFKSELDIVLETDNPEKLMYRGQDMDVVFLDLNLGEFDGLDYIQKLKTHFPALRIIVVTMYLETKMMRDAMKRGADGYLTKRSSVSELQSAVQQVLEGKVYLGDDVMVGSKTVKTEKTKTASSFNRYNVKMYLTNREQEILEQIAAGKSNKDIAAALYISKNTVSVHRKNLMRKLGATSVAALMKIAGELNLIG